MINILLVEDDRPLAMGFIYTLKKEGWNVSHAITLEESRNILKSQEIDLVLLDVTLPDGDGYELCGEIKEKYPAKPVIFMTSCDDESNVVLGLDIGADDYITKPVRLRELISRINANIRRLGITNNKLENDNKSVKLMSDDLEIDVINHTLKVRDKEVLLTLGEYKLLVLLMENYPNAMARNLILEKLWDVQGDFIDGNTLNVYIKRLREKIEEDTKIPYYIETVRGVGYKFAPKVWRE